MNVRVLNSLLIWVSTLSITCVKLVIHCIVWLMIFALVMPAGVNVSFFKNFDFSHDSWVRRNSLTPFTLQAYDRFLTEQVQLCEDRDKNSQIILYA
jgi:hypothetical protein